MIIFPMLSLSHGTSHIARHLLHTLLSLRGLGRCLADLFAELLRRPGATSADLLQMLCRSVYRVCDVESSGTLGRSLSSFMTATPPQSARLSRMEHSFYGACGSRLTPPSAVTSCGCRSGRTEQLRSGRSDQPSQPCRCNSFRRLQELQQL